ncbi:MAG TPA: prolyl oligopeptidase family serine peptidase [Candidatus Dormibacteraeota bacterium]|nr:prolyl oligopeptidase family serine peptidase [Candidatus Dormibacteraeota bacterium]
MDRQYLHGWSPSLGREMELLSFGHAGQPVLVFPTSMGRFYQWEDFGMVGLLASRLAAGRLSLWCLDSVDGESWYSEDRPPDERVSRHLQYEHYVLEEVLPRLPDRPVLTGTSFGAFHAALFCLRHPDRFHGWIGLSGLYDNSRFLDGFHSDETYFTNPLAFLPGLTEERYLTPLRAMSPKVVATGTDDPNVADSVALAEQLQAKGVEVRLDLWPGWQHDWPYWYRMLDQYL